METPANLNRTFSKFDKYQIYLAKTVMDKQLVLHLNSVFRVQVGVDILLAFIIWPG